MKALSLWQPWATAIAVGSKSIETRHWGTAYRGPLLIHAAKRCVKSELADLTNEPAWWGALAPLLWASPLWDVLPFGAIVAVCHLVDCRPTELVPDSQLDLPRRSIHVPTDDGRYDWTERDMGNHAPGRFAWILDRISPIRPIAYRGAQGLFDVPNTLVPFEAAQPS